MADATGGTVTIARQTGRLARFAGGKPPTDGPGQRGAGSGMQERVVNGRRCTNRAGAAEYLRRSLQTINLVASPKRRPETGWPHYVDKQDGQEWYAFDDLDAFRASYLDVKQAARRARVHHVSLDGDPDELMSAKDFYTLLGVDARTFSSYVDKSKPDWQQDRDGYLPKPDKQERGRGGIQRWWKRHRVQTWINTRTGSASSPGRPPRDTTSEAT